MVLYWTGGGRTRDARCVIQRQMVSTGAGHVAVGGKHSVVQNLMYCPTMDEYDCCVVAANECATYALARVTNE